MLVRGVSSISRCGYLSFESSSVLEFRPHFRIFAEPVSYPEGKEKTIYGIAIGWLYLTVALTTEKEQKIEI